MTAPEPPRPEEKRITVPRSARYYTLGGAAASEVWVVLHGFGQLARRFIPYFAPAATPERLIVAPEALNHYYIDHAAKKVGATWMTSEDRQAEITDYVGYMDLVLQEISARGSVKRLEVHGFSQGTATAARWVTMSRMHPARLVLWGGGLPHDMDLALHRETLNAADLTVVIGDRDQYVPEDKVTAEASRLEQAGIRFTLKRFKGGHLIPWHTLQELS